MTSTDVLRHQLASSPGLGEQLRTSWSVQKYTLLLGAEARGGGQSGRKPSDYEGLPKELSLTIFRCGSCFQKVFLAV